MPLRCGAAGPSGGCGLGLGLGLTLRSRTSGGWVGGARAAEGIAVAATSHLDAVLHLPSGLAAAVAISVGWPQKVFQAFFVSAAK